MKRSIIDAINSIHMCTEVEDTAISRVYLVYPTDFTHNLCITVTGINSTWVVKAIASVLYTQLIQQSDRSSEDIGAEMVTCLFNLGLTIGDIAKVEIVPAPYINMDDVSGLVVTELADADSPDGQYNPRATVYSTGEAVWSDYIGFLLDA